MNAKATIPMTTQPTDRRGFPQLPCILCGNADGAVFVSLDDVSQFHCNESTYASAPCPFAPGSEDKIAVLTLRAARRLPLFVEGDAEGARAIPGLGVGRPRGGDLFLAAARRRLRRERA